MEGPVSSCAAPIEFIAGLSRWLIPAKADRNMGSMQASKSGIYSTWQSCRLHGGEWQRARDCQLEGGIRPVAYVRYLAVRVRAVAIASRSIALSAEPYRLDNLQQKAAAIPATTTDPAWGTQRATGPWAED